MNNTQCPYCETIFSVEEDLVQALDARARCGMCRSVFNARDQLLKEATAGNDESGFNDDTVLDFDDVLDDQAPAPPSAPSFTLKTARVPASDDVPDFEFNMVPGERSSRVEADYEFDDDSDDDYKFDIDEDDDDDDDDIELDDTSRFSPPEDFDPDDVEEISLSSKDIPHYDDDPDFEDDDLDTGELPVDEQPQAESDDGYKHNEAFELLGTSTAPPVLKKRRVGLWLLVCLVLLLAIGGQWVYANRDQLLNKPELRPVVNKFCGFLDCRLEPLRDVEQIELLRRSVYSHPNIDEALIISLALVNNADFAQPFPILRIRMADVRGQIVAQRDFEPGSYLDAAASTEKMAPGTPLTVTLEIHDPGNDALTFELEFL